MFKWEGSDAERNARRSRIKARLIPALGQWAAPFTPHARGALIGVKTLPNKGGTCQRTGGVIARRKATLGRILNREETRARANENARGAGLTVPFIFINLIDSVK